MIFFGYLLGLAEHGFAERKVDALLCGCPAPIERAACTRGLRLSRRR